MKNKIVFLVRSTFNKRNYDRYGVSILLGKGFNVEVWDLTPFLKPTHYKNYIPPDTINYKNHSIIHNKKEIMKLLWGLAKNDYVVSMFSGVDRGNYFIFKYLTANSICFGFENSGTIPISIMRSTITVTQKIRKHIRKPHILVGNLFNRFANSLYKIHPANFFIIGGSATMQIVKNMPSYGKKTDIINAHAFDYDLFLEEEKSFTETYKGVDYAVMLDQYNPYHVDNIDSGAAVDVNTYYTDLNNYFEIIEQNLGFDVVIAAHPSSHYENMENPFGGRKIIFGKTMKLVKNSKLVLTHSSTSVNFAILYKKPLLILTSSDYSIRYKWQINALAKSLSKIPVNIINCRNIPDGCLEIDKNSYEEFFELYIKSPGTPEKYLWEIFVDYINRNIEASQK